MPVEAVPTTSFIRPKLKVGVVDDPLEHEADRAAEQVMRPPKLDPSGTLAPPQTSRKCAASEGEARLSVQAKPMEALHSITKDARAFVHEAARTPGEPLGTSTRAFFEPRFGHDFTQVRVHTDSEAAATARAMDARAYTVGKHLVFAGGQYQPHTTAGRRLLAHELAHVVQQSGSRMAGPLTIGVADAPQERAAEVAAEATLRGEAAPPVHVSEVTVRRQGAGGSPRQATASPIARIYIDALQLVKTMDPAIFDLLKLAPLGAGPKDVVHGVIAADPSQNSPQGETIINLEVALDPTLTSDIDAQFDSRATNMTKGQLPSGGPIFTFFPVILVNPSLPPGTGARELAEVLVHEGTHLQILIGKLGTPPSRHSTKFARYEDVAKQQGATIQTRIDRYIDLVLTRANLPNTASARVKDASQIVSLLVEEKYVYDQDAARFQKLRGNSQIAEDYIRIGLDAKAGIPRSKQPTTETAQLIKDATDFLDALDRWVHNLPPPQTAPDIVPPPQPVRPRP